VSEIPPQPPGYIPDHPEQDIWVDVKVPEDIKVVTTDKSNAISSIQLGTGEWVCRKSRSALMGDLLVPLLFPVIGFLVPGGAMKVIVWVGRGFFEMQRSA